MTETGVASKLDATLGRFADDLWIERLASVSEIIAALEKLKATSEAADTEAIGEYVRFFKFLESYCSGRNFTSDKQWSDLMKAMQISRKLNHRSVKVRDLVQSKQLIESNKSDIRTVNELAHLSRVIESSIERLQASISGCQLDLSLASPSKSSAGNEKLTFIIDKLSLAIDYLRDQCWPLLDILKAELSRDLVKRCAQVEAWHKEVARLESLLSLISATLDMMRDFQSNLSRLSPLINATGGANNKQSSNKIFDQQSQLGHILDQSIDECRCEFERAAKFNKTLVSFLVEQKAKLQLKERLRKPQTRSSKEIDFGLPFIKLVNTVNLSLTSDLLGEQLGEASRALQQCSHKLNKIMQTIRLEFGRFYFLNDLELLHVIALDIDLLRPEVSSDIGDSISSESLIRKLFDNSISGFLVRDHHIVAVKSPAGELLHLYKESPVALNKLTNVYSLQVVRVLNETLRKLRRALKSLLVESVLHQEAVDWSLPIQLVDLSERLKFTRRVEEALRLEAAQVNVALERLTGLYETRFDQLAEQESSLQPDENDSQPGRLRDLKRSAISSLTVGFLSTLLALSVRSGQERAWLWFRQVKYYLMVTKEPNKAEQNNQPKVLVRIADAEFEYKFDYAPVACDFVEAQRGLKQKATYKRLVWTKSTERCVLLASQALGNWRLGANPFGPAGSGKTETIKALGQLLGCQVIVYNCDESNDSASIERLVWGLAHCGLWGCFDEFNRLSSSVLSSVSATLELVQTSLREQRYTVELPGDSSEAAGPSGASAAIRSIDRDCAFFVTLNPGDASRYRGRRQLPANLRSLFLPVAMVEVHYESIIGERLLALQSRHKSIQDTGSKFGGLREATRVGEQVASWLRAAKTAPQALASVQTCEWDLRLVMAILSRLDSLIERSTGEQGNLKGRLVELLVAAIMHEVEPRLPSDLVAELRSSLELSFGRLETSLWASYAVPASNAHLFKSESERLLSCHLFNQLETHLGVLLLGATQSGKSRSWKLLRDTLNGDHQRVKCLPLNPRACNKSSLFGSVDPLSRKWTDGQLTWIVREALKLLSGGARNLEQVWIVLDGPIDPDWIELLNSVLDDNQVLTLGSGERLNFAVDEFVEIPNDPRELKVHRQRRIKLIFETNSIQFASPATISRLGVVQFSQNFAITNQQIGEMDSSETILEVLTKLLSSNLEKFLLLVGDCSQLAECIFSSDTSDFPSSWCEYNCCESSTSRQLLDWIIEHRRSSLILIKNLHLIRPEDQWQTRSFLELFRFILTYGYFYQEDGHSNFCKIDTSPIKFVATCSEESITQLDTRFTSLASRILRFKEETKVSSKLTSLKELAALLGDISNSEGRSISTLTSATFDLFSIETIVKTHLKGNLNRFNHSSEVQRSFETLNELLDRNKSSSQQATKETRLFVATSLEISMMEPQTRAHLFHLLNKLKESKKPIKFFHFVTKHAATSDDNFVTLWKSFGAIYNLDDGDTNKSNLSNKIEAKLGEFADEDSSYKLDKQDIDYITGKVSILRGSQLEELATNEFVADCYFRSIGLMLVKFGAKLMEQRESLQRGLECLVKFESRVEQMKLRCREQSFELAAKKQEIEQTISSLDKSLAEATRQRARLADLQAKQEDKDKELKAKFDKLERELAQVTPVMERSRAELATHLKPEALNEIRTLRSPPKVIQEILEVLLALLQVSDRSWQSMKSFLSRRSFKEELLNYDFRSSLSASLVEQAKGMRAAREQSFNLERASRASSAIVPIVHWIEATIAYGEVVIKLKPLNEQMNSIRGESDSLREQSAKLELEQSQVEAKISLDQNKLAQLQREYQESKQQTEAIELSLDRALRARGELDDQLASWRVRLQQGEWLLLERQRLAKVCLSLASLAISFARPTKLPNAWMWLELFELTEMQSASRYLDKVESLLLEDDERLAPETDAIEQETQLGARLRLVALSMALDFLSPAVCFLEASKGLPSGELTEQLTRGNILVAQESDLVLVSWSSATQIVADSRNQLQSVETQLALGKLVVLELGASRVDLDLLRFLLEFAARNRLKSSGGQMGRLLIAGSFEAQPEELKQILVCFSGWTTNRLSLDESQQAKGSQNGSSQSELSAEILELLVQYKDSKLSQQIGELRLELCTRQREMRRLEARLLKRLAEDQSKLAPSDEATLVECLGKTSELSKSLASDVSQANAKLGELRASYKLYEELANEMAAFYWAHIAPVALRDASLCHLPLDQFTRLVAEATTDLELRHKFLEDLKRHKRVDELVDLSSAQLGAMLAELVARPPASGRAKASARLAVVLHEQGKTSAQLEVDEFFAALRVSQSSTVSYEKYYATSDSSSGHILSRALAASSSSSSNKPTNKTSWRVICLANAHLAAKWLNANIAPILAESAPEVVLLLVAEHSPAASREQLGPQLLAAAQLKCWHDELSLGPWQRFQLLASSPIFGAKLAELSASQVEPQRRQLAERLAKEILLLHVVCQELNNKPPQLDESSASSREAEKRWSRKYAFELEQLQLALKTLVLLAGKSHFGSPTDGDLRRLVALYLESIVYGSQMESYEDETRLGELVARFLGSQESAEQQMSKLHHFQPEGAQQSSSLISHLLS